MSNTTEMPLPLTLHVDGIAPAQRDPVALALKPYETRLVEVGPELMGDTGQTLLGAGGISIQYIAAKTALLAQVMVKDVALGYSSVVDLLDPQQARSSELHGAGIRLGEVAGEELTPVIVAK